jgi:hypothetical protein
MTSRMGELFSGSPAFFFGGISFLGWALMWALHSARGLRAPRVNRINWYFYNLNMHNTVIIYNSHYLALICLRKGRGNVGMVPSIGGMMSTSVGMVERVPRMARLMSTVPQSNQLFPIWLPTH